jgi:Tfp pilus assembly protein PilF
MATARPAPADRWLYGPASDLAIGCGLWYAAAFVVLSAFGQPILEGGARAWLPFLSLAISTPHYGATLVRAYGRAEDRRAYAVFTLYATAMLVALLAWGARDVAVGSWILTLYITWSPWHYTGQNYGIAVMFLRRRGAALDDGTKRWLYASFGLSYALTFFALHGGASTQRVAPVSYAATRIQFHTLGFDPSWAGPLLTLLAVAYLLVTGIAVARLRRGSSFRDLAPGLALIGTQALWFPVPLVLKHLGVATGLHPWESPDGSYYFLWIATGHAAQYLWVSSYYARFQGGGAGVPYFARTLLAGAAVWTLPALAFAPGALGTLAFDGGLATLVASIVNLHHFVLDGAIWKLRDGRVARVLLRSRESAGTPEPIGPRRRPLALTGWIVGGLCVALLFGAKFESDVRLRRALQAREPQEAARVLDRLARFGRDSASARAALADLLASSGDPRGALREYGRANEIRPQAGTWQRIAALHARADRDTAAAAAYAQAIALAPDTARLHYEHGQVLLRAGRADEARDAFQRAVDLDPERGIHRTMLERATAAAARTP